MKNVHIILLIIDQNKDDNNNTYYLVNSLINIQWQMNFINFLKSFYWGIIDIQKAVHI